MFFGEYRHQLDEKGRIRIPAKLRNKLSDNYSITKGANGCLVVLTEDELKKVTEKIVSPELNDFDTLKLNRTLFSSLIEAEEDNQGRVSIPQNLRDFAKIKKNVVTIGAGARIEIWAEEEWDKYLNEEDFDTILKKTQKQ